MASYEENLFWEEHLPLLKSNSHSRTRGSLVVPHDNDILTPIPASSTPPSPLVTLPVEILCRIFHLCIREYEDHPDNLFLVEADSEGPTKLIQICRYWRTVALGDPTLWASIKVFYEDPKCVQRVRLWIIRTGTICPLNFGLGYTDDPQTGEAVMKLYLTQIHRWHKILFEFFPDRTQNLQNLAQLPHGSTSQLRTIALHCDECPLEMVHDAWAALTSTSSLRAVHLDDWTPGFLPPVPWHQLTYLSFRTIDGQGISDALRHCQQLEFLEIYNSFDFDSLPSHPIPVILPSLRRLYVSVQRNSGPLLDCLTTPSLHHLTIFHNMCDEVTPQPGSVHKLLCRSSCKLEFFELFDHGLDEQQFIEYIQSPMLSTVRSARLAGRLSDKVIEKLIVGNEVSATNSSSLFPFLGRLDLRNCRAVRSRFLEEMILSRVVTGHFKSLKIIGNEGCIPRSFVSDMEKQFGTEVVVY